MRNSCGLGRGRRRVGRVRVIDSRSVRAIEDFIENFADRSPVAHRAATGMLRHQTDLLRVARDPHPLIR